jgi:hypothetical protein
MRKALKNLHRKIGMTLAYIKLSEELKTALTRKKQRAKH